MCRIVAVAAFGIAVSSGVAVATTEDTDSAAAAAIALSPQQEAIKLALLSDQGEGVRQHYEFTGYRGVWFDAVGGAEKAEALLAALEAADRHALPVDRYRLPIVRAAVAAAGSADPAARAAAELALSRSFLTYARDLSSGVLEPRAVDRELHVFPERPDEALLLDRMAAAPSADAVLASLAPANAEYSRLVDELAALRGAPLDLWGAQVPDGGSIRLGERGSRIESMRARLIAMGDHAPTRDGIEPDVYDVALEESVRAFQRRHGLNDDGVAGRRTIAAMNVDVSQRIDQIVVNLERMRWLNKDLGERHVYVNQADFTVRLMDRGEVAFQERVVVGKARKHRTPEFSDQMTYMVFNPIWHVPRSIATEEILPKLQEDPEYLLKKNMRLVAPGGDAPDPLFTDWSLYTQADFPYRIKQNSGGGNALGRVKFMFPNQFAIYLHDTPSKSLFRKDGRAFSHGCVRVQDPMAFAEALLAPQRDDPAAYIQRLLRRSGEVTVNLAEPVPVHLTYRTAWIDDAGVRQYRADVYGRDGRVLAALKAAGVGAAADG